MTDLWLASAPLGARGERIRVLFLCTGNSARSQIAEALLAKKAGDRFVVASAGTAPATAVRPEAVAALADAGIDWSAARPKGIDGIGAQDWDMVITLCDRALETCPTLPGRPVTAHWGIPDPASSGQDASTRQKAFGATLSLLAWRIDLMLALRPELLDKLVLEERLRMIGRETLDHPSADDARTTTADVGDTDAAGHARHRPHGEAPLKGVP